MILFFDTETTGKANFKLPPDHRSQPRLVQLAAILTDDTGEHEIATLNTVIKPEGFAIPYEASEIHGITTEYATKHGVQLADAIGVFKRFLKMASLSVGHNIEFDQFVIDGELARLMEQPPVIDSFCTMKAMTDICGIPGPYGNKWPKLQEAYERCFGSTFDDAHDAMADVMACKAVYFWLKHTGEPGNAKLVAAGHPTCSICGKTDPYRSCCP